MKFCGNCGIQIADDANVCPNCGCPSQAPSHGAAPAPGPAPMYAPPRPVAPAVSKNYASLVLGILGIVFAWLFALVGHVLSIVGICLGVKELKRTGSPTGLVLSIIGEVCSIASSLIGILSMAVLF